MQRIDAIEKAIKLNDIEGLRVAIADVCYIRRDFSTGEFDELVDYVINKGIELKDDKLVGQLISEGKTTFTEDDFPMAILELKENFCDERIEDVKKIGRALYGKSEQKPIEHGMPENLGTEPKRYGNSGGSNNYFGSNLSDKQALKNQEKRSIELTELNKSKRRDDKWLPSKLIERFKRNRKAKTREDFQEIMEENKDKR